MTAKEYLRQIAALDAKITGRLKQLENLKHLAAVTRSPSDISPDKVQTSVEGDRMAAIIAEWVDIEREIDDDVDKLVRTKHRIIGEIHQLADARYIQILELRYVELMTFEQIADEMGIVLRHVYRLHGGALEAFRKEVIECHH